MAATQKELRQYVRSLRNTGLINYTSDEGKDDLPFVINGTPTDKGLDCSMAMLRKVAVEKMYPPTGGTAGYQDKDDPEPEEEQAQVAVHREAKPSKEQKIQELLGSLGEILGEGNGRPQGVDKSAIQEIAEKAAKRTLQGMIKDGLPERVVVLKDLKRHKFESTLMHYQFADILKAVSTRQNVYLHGAAGCGKTHMMRMVAEALGVPFYFTSRVFKEHGLMGWTNVDGYVETPFFKAFTGGGLMLFDEMDISSPPVLSAMNAPLANGMCDFPAPIGIKKAHKDFYMIGCGNTLLNGATAQFSARQSFDAAIKDRFPIFIELKYDNKLESNIAKSAHKDGEAVAKRVQSIRAAVDQLKVRMSPVTMRATEAICDSLSQGFTMRQAEEMVIWAKDGLDPQKIKTIKAKAEEIEAR